MGTITRYWRTTAEALGNVEVSYEVNGVSYRVRESLKAKSEAIKIGPIPIGQRTYSVLKDAEVGKPAAVCYDPDDPSRAFIRDNTGIRTG